MPAKAALQPTFTPCGAQTRSGGRCAKRPTIGNKRCNRHGGVGRKQDERRAREVIRRSLTDLVIPIDPDDPEADPVEGFLCEYRRTIAAIRYWDGELAALTERKDLTYGLTKEEEIDATEFGGVNRTYETKLNIAYEARFRERQHLHDLLKTWITARMDEKRQTVMARFLDQWQTTIDTLVTALGHDVHDAKTRAVVTKVLEG